MKKLKSHAKSIIAISIALLVLISTNGIIIYNHHCNSSNTSNYSLFIAASACEMHTTKPAIISCCHNESENILEKCDTKSEIKGCCTNQLKVVKLDTNTVLNHSTPSIKVTEIQSQIVPNAFYTFAFKRLYASWLTKNTYKFSPPHSTTKYLSYIQVYLI